MTETPPSKSTALRTGRRQKTTAPVSRIIGELLLTVGVLLALFVIYEAYWTNLISGRMQKELNAQMEQSWADAGGVEADEPLAPPALGEGFARLHMPRLDSNYAIVEGTRNEDLAAGPGHYVETQMPGEPGNFALAGHRIGSGAVFQYIDRLDVCDAVVIETRTEWITYRLLPRTSDPSARRADALQCMSPEQAERVAGGEYAHVSGRFITTPYDRAVLDPIPGRPWAAEDPETDLENMLTLTTCHPMFSNSERMIVHAVEVETVSKSAVELPDALRVG